MKHLPGRTPAVTAITLCILSLFLMAYIFKDALLERWYILRLNADDKNARKSAAKRLWQMNSKAAVRPRMAAAILEGQPPNGDSGVQLVVRFLGTPLHLPDRCYVDIETGSGHGAYLSFLRLGVTRGVINAERVVWLGRSMTRSVVSGKVSRALVAIEDGALALEAIRLLPTVSLKESERSASLAADAGRTFSVPESRGAWMSSENFFVLVRVVDQEKTLLFEQEYAGYEGNLHQREYLPLQAVCHLVSETVKEHAMWEEVPKGDWRGTHFPDAFTLNRKYMMRRSYWWVAEYSVEALGLFGDERAIPVLEYLGRCKTNNGRLSKRIEETLRDPEYWLEGPPKVVNSRSGKGEERLRQAGRRTEG